MIMLEHKECYIEQGCSYSIKVETSNGKIKSNITYAVPGELLLCNNSTITTNDECSKANPM